MDYRLLKASEIDARVGTVGAKGVTLLLYKDARVDMAILDETHGSEFWQRDHREIKGHMYAGVGVWNKEIKQFIWKWDCGTESFTEKEATVKGVYKKKDVKVKAEVEVDLRFGTCAVADGKTKSCMLQHEKVKVMIP